MSKVELGIKLREELIDNVWDVIFRTGVLGLFKKGCRNVIIDSIQFDEQEFSCIDSCTEYDNWHSIKVNLFHQKLIPHYKENQKVDSKNPYTYTARIFNQFVKLYLLQIVFADPFTFGKFFEFVHPIFTNKFIESLVTDIKSVTDMNSQIYQEYIGLYRHLIDDPLCDYQGYKTIALIDGLDI